MSEANKKLYDKIINSVDLSIDNIPEAGFALGYPYFGGNKTTLLKHGGNDVTRVKRCEDTIFVPGQGEFEATVLIIGGGGGGGTGIGGGGGGAGGHRAFTKKFYTSIAYPVTVGAGGSASSDGSDSSIEKIATGGGAGGSQADGNGNDGGSGGGGGGNFSRVSGSSTVSHRCNGSSQGNDGGTGGNPFAQSAGGGGSAAAGQDCSYGGSTDGAGGN